MEYYRKGSRVVATLDLTISSVGLFHFLWNMDTEVWADPESILAAVHLIIIGCLGLEIVAAMLLFVATLLDTPPFTAILFCNCWRCLNLTWICVLVLAHVHMMFHGAFIPGWAYVFTAVIQIIVLIVAMYIVFHFVKKLRSSATATEGGTIGLY